MTTVVSGSCLNCGAVLVGPYCAHCGEAAHAHDYSVRHAAGELLESVAHVDGRVFASCRALLVQPGLLARRFLDGRRRSQMNPVQTFFVCNVIYFLILPFTSFATFTTTLKIHIDGGYWWGRLAYDMAAARVAARHLSWKEYEHAFNEMAHLQGHTLLVIIVPMFALGFWALFGRTRRYYAEHLVVAFYTWAFGLLWLGASTIALSYGFRWYYVHVAPVSGEALEAIADVVVGGGFGIYVFLSTRSVYGESRLMSLWKTAALIAWLLLVTDVYKFILFFTTFYAA